MFLVRTAVLVIGVCGHLLVATAQFALGQEFVAEPTHRIDPAAVYLNPLYVNQWVSLNANKGFHGKLISFGEAGMVLPRSAVEVTIAQKGKTVSRVITDADGMFQFKDIAVGSYSFVAQSDYCFATFGIHILPVGSGSPSSFEVCVSGLASATAKELIKDNWVPAESGAAEVFHKDPLGDKRVVSTSPKVLLQNGDLFGQVSRPGLPISEQDLTGNVAHIFQGGRSIAAAPVGRDGTFRIMNLAMGVYDLAVVGEDGNAVIGFEAIRPNAVTVKRTSGAARLVSFQDASDRLTIELAEPVEIGEGPEEVPFPAVQDSGQPFIGGGFPARGGFGSGGGGFGGGGAGGGGIAGGGIGGLLGIAGLAVGVAALSNNDNFNPQLASIIAP